MKHLLPFFFIFIASLTGPAATGAEKLSPAGAVEPAGDWSQYSYGLFYKNAASLEKDSEARRKYLVRAVEYFEKAGASGMAMDRVFYQLSECHYVMGNIDRSLDYAQKSIALNNEDLKPYNRVYTILLSRREYSKAAEILQEYLKVKPNSIQVEFVLAEHYQQRLRDVPRAMEAYRRVIDIARVSPVEDYYRESAYFSLGYLAFSSNDLPHAIEYFDAALAINPENQKVRYYLALVYMDQYNLERAEYYAQSYAANNPQDKVIASVLGRIRYFRGDAAALRFFRESRSKVSVDGLLSWGLYHEMMREDEQGEQILKTVTQYLPRDITLHVALARIYARGKDTNAAYNEYLTAGLLMMKSRLYLEAKAAFQEAAELDESIPASFYYLGRLHEEMGKPYLAIHYYRRAYAIKPDVDMLLHIGYLYGMQKDYTKAMKNFNAACAREPANSKPWFFMGLVSMWQEDYPLAEQRLQKAVTLESKNEAYYFYLAMVMDKLHRVELAIDNLKKAIQNNPQSARALNYLGYLYADHNREIDESLALIQKALDLEPGNGAYVDSLGWAYYRKGDYDQALKNLLIAEDILRKARTPDAVVFDHIGDTYHRLGRVKVALEYWRKSIEMKKDSKVEQKIQQNEPHTRGDR